MTMNGDNCFCISIRKPSGVSSAVMALQGMIAPSYGPGFVTLEANAAASAISSVGDEEEEDAPDSDGGGGGGALGFMGGGGGRGGASHCM